MSASRIVMEDARLTAAASELPWSRLSGKSVLVTGGSGALGAYFVEALLAASSTSPRPIKVVCLVRSLEKAHLRFVGHLTNPDLSFIVGDVAEFQASQGYDFIFHAASNATPRYYSTDPVGTIVANVEGTRRLLEAARHGGAEGFLFVSSGEVYGQTETVPTAEGNYGYIDPAAVRSCYAESKRLGETLCVAYGQQHGVSTYIVRPFHTYGPTMALDDGRVYADFVADVVAKRGISVKGDGLARRAFCYASDATRGFLTVMLTGEANLPYNVGDEDSEVSIADLARRLVTWFPDRSPGVIFEERPAGAAYMVSPITRNAPDTGRLRSLGWRPRVTIEEGFRRTVQSFLEGAPI